MAEQPRFKYSPRWAPHVEGWYENRPIEEDGTPGEAPVGGTCTVCGESFTRRCSSGLMRNHIANFALAHAHRDAKKT